MKKIKITTKISVTILNYYRIFIIKKKKNKNISFLIKCCLLANPKKKLLEDGFHHAKYDYRKTNAYILDNAAKQLDCIHQLNIFHF